MFHTRQAIATPEADTRDDMRGAESDLFDLGEVLLRVAVQHKLANLLQRHKFLGPHFGGV